MAEKLLQYYKFISDLSGLQGRIDLAKETNLPTPKAAIAPDSEENIKKFRDAIKRITKKSAPKF